MTDMATKYGPGLEESRETSPVYLASPGSAESVNLDLFYLVSVCERFDCTLGPRSNVSVYCPGAVADDCSDAGARLAQIPSSACLEAVRKDANGHVQPRLHDSRIGCATASAVANVEFE